MFGNSIKCDECDAIYYGQTKRSIEKRFCEYLSYIKNKQALDSHALNTGHPNYHTNNINVVKLSLDPFESYYIQLDSNSMNLDNGNIESVLFSRV